MESTEAEGSDSFRTVTGSAYQFLMPLAEGGMGRVDVVVRRDGQFRRLYALKRLHAKYRSDEAFRSMFLDEARIAGLLRHPNAVSVLDVGEDEHGPFLVMDYVDGVPLSTILKGVRRSGRAFPVQLAVSVVEQAALGLHAAHELKNYDGTALGLVHRDVSPQNILVSFNGAVQMTDFGVAKALGRLTKTQSGVLKGKYGYMSPEQLRFQDIDRRSDLFALGVVLFELLAGRRLYGNGGEGEAPAPRRILEEAPPDIGEERAELMPELVELCFELLAKDPNGRPASAKSVADRLGGIARALELEEGRLELSAYMLEHFGDERDATQARVESVMSEMASAPPLGAVVSTSESAESERPRRVGAWRPYVLAGLVFAGLGAAYFVGRDASQPASVRAEPPDDAPRVGAFAPPVDAAEGLDAGEPVAPDASTAGAEQGVEDRGAPASTMRRRTRPRSMRRPPRTPMNESMMRRVWMWPDDQ